MTPPIHPQIVAHRGWTETHLENTAEAIHAAVEHGCRAVEFDVRRTRDGRWVVYHDPDLRRLHGQPHVIAEHPLDELRRFAPLPLLEDVLGYFHPECLPLVEIKQADDLGIAELAALLQGFTVRFPLVAISRGERVTELLRREAPGVYIYIYARDWQNAEAHAANPAVAGFDLWSAGLVPEDAAPRLARLQEHGKKAAVWTVNDPAECRRWLAAGAAWVITDYPWRMQ